MLRGCCAACSGPVLRCVLVMQGLCIPSSPPNPCRRYSAGLRAIPAFLRKLFLDSRPQVPLGLHRSVWGARAHSCLGQIYHCSWWKPSALPCGRLREAYNRSTDDVIKAMHTTRSMKEGADVFLGSSCSYCRMQGRNIKVSESKQNQALHSSFVVEAQEADVGVCWGSATGRRDHRQREERGRSVPRRHWEGFTA